MRKSVLNIAVIYGGRSCENEISVITGTMAANVLDREKFRPFPVYLTQSGKFYTGDALFDLNTFSAGVEKKAQEAEFSGGKLYTIKGNKRKEIAKIDCAVNCCHGLCGEDGVVSAILDLNGIANASPDLFGSALFMDKAATKLWAKSLGINVLPYVKITEDDYLHRTAFVRKFVKTKLGFPVIVKPSRQGSSIGVFVAENDEKLVFSLRAAFVYDSVVIVEKYLSERREINCAAYRQGENIVLSECEEPKTDNAILTFSDKYLSDGGKERASTLPAKITEKQANTVKEYTRTLYKKSDLRGIVRADFLLSGDDVYFNEMNTVPGSLAYYLFCENLSGFSNLLALLIGQGIRDAEVRAGKKMLRNCGVLGKNSAAHGKRR